MTTCRNAKSTRQCSANIRRTSCIVCWQIDHAAPLCAMLPADMLPAHLQNVFAFPADSIPHDFPLAFQSLLLSRMAGPTAEPANVRRCGRWDRRVLAVSAGRGATVWRWSHCAGGQRRASAGAAAAVVLMTTISRMIVLLQYGSIHKKVDLRGERSRADPARRHPSQNTPGSRLCHWGSVLIIWSNLRIERGWRHFRG